MWIYIIVFFVAMFLSEIAVIEKNKGNVVTFKIFAVLSFLPVFLISAFRYNVGTDFRNYETYFYYVKDGSQLEGIERGYWLLTKVSTLISDDPVAFFFLSSLVVCGFVFVAIYQQSVNPPISIFLFFGTTMYFVSFNGIRQMMASAVLIYCLKYVEQRNLKKFAIGIVLATLFHSSAILFAPVYLLEKIRINPKRIIIFLILMTGAFPVLDDVIAFISNLLGYSGYFDSRFNTGQFEIWFFLINVCVLALNTVLFKPKENDKRYQCYYWVQFIAFVSTALSSMMPLANRITWYFMFVQIISIPWVLKKERDHKVKVVLTLLVCVSYFCVAYIGIGIQGSHSAVPYQSIFNS